MTKIGLIGRDDSLMKWPNFSKPPVVAKVSVTSFYSGYVIDTLGLVRLKLYNKTRKND